MDTVTLSRPDFKSRTRALARRQREGTWLLKACRRCGGDLVLQADEYGDEEFVCIQCGASRPVAPEAA